MSGMIMQLLGTAGIGAAFLLGLSGCSSPTKGQAGTALPAKADASRFPQRIVQLNYGEEARFALCIEPACPIRTIKTMADESILALDRRPMDGVDAESIRPVPLRFASGSSSLTAKALGELKRTLRHARLAERIVVRVRTLATGADAANEKLAKERAARVSDFYVKRVPGAAQIIEVDALSVDTIKKSKTALRTAARSEVILVMPGNRSIGHGGA